MFSMQIILECPTAIEFHPIMIFKYILSEKTITANQNHFQLKKSLLGDPV